MLLHGTIGDLLKHDLNGKGYIIFNIIADVIPKKQTWSLLFLAETELILIIE